MSIGRKFISAFFVLVLILGLQGCLKAILLMPYGDDPFHPHFAEESYKNRGTLAGTVLKVDSFYVYEKKYPELITEKTVWGFSCPREGVRVKEIVYGIVPEGCTETFKNKPLMPMTLYSVSGSFGRGIIGGVEFFIFDKNGEYELKYPKDDVKRFADFANKVLNSPAATMTNSSGVE